MAKRTNSAIDCLRAVLRDIGSGVIAVSGGIDSMTLALVAHDLPSGPDITIAHAVSPAVPPAATERVQRYAKTNGWRLDIVDAGEFSDPAYLSNPVNRCFFCKSRLYGTIARKFAGQIMSGTNAEDLRDYRPGLTAARDHRVRHPFVEAGIGKDDIRRIASALGYETLARLPASPCLSSRMETGLRVDPYTLRAIDRIEDALRKDYGPSIVRCRIRRDGPVIEVDEATLAAITGAQRQAIADLVRSHLPDFPRATFARYSMGSAFLRVRGIGADHDG